VAARGRVYIRPMKSARARRLALPLAAGAVLWAAGCGGGTKTFVCEPACPTGFACTAAGCAGPPVDLAAAAAAPDLAGSQEQCAAACPATTPYCTPELRCAPCLTDKHCPALSICQPLGASTVCVPGCRDDAGCSGAGSACCDGQCVDVEANAQHCGACQVACQFPHAGGGCAQGACVVAGCEPGWADCNAVAGDGCETNLVIDPQSCGACGAACALAHATSACSAEGCFPAGCDFGWGDCDNLAASGCETRVLDDLHNCGQCGNTCPPAAHATVSCLLAECAVSACSAGFGDCDGALANGCETTLGSDAKNCGQCGNVCGPREVCVNGGCTCQKCSLPHARTRCANQMCVFDVCLPGFGDCNGNQNDGCETPVNADPKNCGGCGLACGGKTPFCEGGKCTDISASCHDVLQGNPLAPDGTYTIDPDGNGPIAPYVVYCDMTTDGGGWTAFFVGVVGSPNVFAHFEDVEVSCADPATQCLRRLPASVTVDNQILATCGDASVRYNIDPLTLNYYANGVQGGGWIHNSNQVAIGGGADVTLAAQSWTGQGGNKGWIVSANVADLSRTFSSSYNLNNSWDWCNGMHDLVSVVRLLYR